MEKLDIYDENMNYLGEEDREVVHSEGLWHKTVHCWLYDEKGNIYFQIRKNSQKLYTTSSGHVQAGESVKEAFHREVMEEIGIDVNIDEATLVEIKPWTLNKIKNGKPFKDRAFAHVYLNLVDENIDSFNLCEEEVSGVVKINAKDCLDLMCNKLDSINAVKFTDRKEQVIISQNDFLVREGELAILKYGKILQYVIDIINKNDIQL